MALMVVNVRVPNTKTLVFMFENRGNELNSHRISCRVKIVTILNGFIESNIWVSIICAFEHFLLRSWDKSARKMRKNTNSKQLWMVHKVVERVFLYGALFLEHAEKMSETDCVYKIWPGRWVYKRWRFYVYRNIWENVLKWN